MENIAIRKYLKADRQSVRDIAWETAFMGESADIFFSDKELFADFLTLYFTDYEPESCFVAEYKGDVIGYVLGSRNESMLKRTYMFKIIPALIVKGIARGILLKGRDMKYLRNCLISFIKGEFNGLDFSIEYPAILHINITERCRRFGIGSRLISAFLEYLAAEKTRGVHLSTMAKAAGDFFRSNGFNLVHSMHRSYFRHILNKDIMVYIYAKKLALNG